MTEHDAIAPYFRSHVLIIHADEGWYPIQASGSKPLAEEAADHGALNSRIQRIEDIDENILWRRQ